MSQVPADSSCLNCAAPMGDKDNFCSVCGQKRAPVIVPFRQFFREFAEDYFTFDNKIFRSLYPLLLKPGYLTREYLEGKRARFIPPFRLFIFTSVIFFLVIGTFSDDPSSRPVKIKADGVKLDAPDEVATGIRRMGIDAYIDSIRPNLTGSERFLVKQSVKMHAAGSGGLKSTIFSYASRLLFLMIPFFAFLVKLFYLRQKLYYSAHFIFALHFHSFLFIALLILFGLSSLGLEIPPPVIAVLLGTYLFFALKKTYGQKTGRTIWKTICLVLVYVLLFMPLFFLLLILSLFFFY